MTWLLKLYPPGWRRRYGDELVALIGAQRFSLATAIDVIAGAIDAWTSPQTTAAPPKALAWNGEEKMSARMLKLRCAGYGPNVTSSDQWKSAIATVGGTLVLTLAWMGVHVKVGDNPYTDSLSLMPFLVALLFGMRWTYLKGRSALTQTIFIAGNLAVLTAIFLIAGWISARL